MALYLGYSGIHGSVESQLARYPDADPRIAGFAQGKDAAAALVSETEIIAAAAEERFTGHKGTGNFPVNAIQYCLREAGAEIADIDKIAHAFDYRIDPAVAAADPDLAQRFHDLYSRSAQEELIKGNLGTSGLLPKIGGVQHHLAHAHSAFDLSGFNSAVVIVSDGMGEDSSLTLFEAQDGKYRCLATIPAGHSMGVLYALVTYHLGFVPGMDEYKVMALAALGDPERFSKQFSQLVSFSDGGLYLIPALGRERGRRSQDLHVAALRRLTELFGPARRGSEDLNQMHWDLAAALQATLNSIMLRTGHYARRLSTAADVCLAGGVALNCVANSHLADSAVFDRIFIQPAAGDDGSALGAALSAASGAVGWQGGPMGEPYWGSGFSDAELIAVANAESGPCAVSVLSEMRLCESAAEDIAAGLVIGWFQGRMEFGPRALGNRSILADPRSAEMRDRVNRAIKNRESFRPLAPAVIAEEAGNYFELRGASADRYRHMLFVARIRPEYVGRLAAVAHSDQTARLQTVRRHDNPRFYDLLREIGHRIGMPVVLNTSLNVQGQPVVRTPSEALSTARHAGLDCIYLGTARISFQAS